MEIARRKERNDRLSSHTLYYVPVNSLTADKDEPVLCVVVVGIEKKKRQPKWCVFVAHDGSVDRCLNTT